MTEQEYIYVSDLQRIRIAKAILRDIIPASNRHIPDAEYEMVVQTLIRWERAIYHHEIAP